MRQGDAVFEAQAAPLHDRQPRAPRKILLYTPPSRRHEMLVVEFAKMLQHGYLQFVADAQQAVLFFYCRPFSKNSAISS